MPKLAKTTFQTGPDDEPLVVDVYGKKTTEVLNGFNEAEINGLDLPNLIGDNQDISGFPFPGLDPSGLTPDTLEALGEKILNSNASISDALKNIDLTVISKRVDGIKDFNTVFDGNGGLLGRIKGGVDLGRLTSISGAIDSLTNGNFVRSFGDRNTLSTIAGNIAVEASKIGLGAVFSKIAPNLPGADVIFRAASIAIPAAIKTGDIGLFKDVAVTVGVSEMLKLAPDGVKRIVDTMVRPDNLPQSSFPEYYKDTKSALSGIDIDWATCKRPAGNILNGIDTRGSGFFGDLRRSSVINYPIGIVPAPAGYSKNYINTRNADVDNPDVFDAVFGTGGTPESRAATREAYKNDQGRINDNTDNRFNKIIEAATKMGISTVGKKIKETFPFVNIKTDDIYKAVKDSSPFKTKPDTTPEVSYPVWT